MVRATISASGTGGAVTAARKNYCSVIGVSKYSNFNVNDLDITEDGWYEFDLMVKGNFIGKLSAHVRNGVFNRVSGNVVVKVENDDNTFSYLNIYVDNFNNICIE